MDLIRLGLEPEGSVRRYLVRIPHRKRHSIQRDVLLASAIAGPNRRIHGPTPNISAFDVELCFL
jgi:hypothetical protein